MDLRAIMPVKRLVLGALCLLAACDAPAVPLTMPNADGRPQIVTRLPYKYVVGAQVNETLRSHIFLRVTRQGGPDMDYSDGFIAKAVVVDFCARYNRKLDPSAFGAFSAPASWIFNGGCL